MPKVSAALARFVYFFWPARPVLTWPIVDDVFARTAAASRTESGANELTKWEALDESLRVVSKIATAGVNWA